MKKIILLTIFSASVAMLSAQKETFDLTTYTPPKGWKKEASQTAVQFKKEDAAKGTYCIITLFKGVPGITNSKENFDLAWTSVVKEMVTVSAAPEMQPASTENGWEVQSGFAPFESSGNKGVVVLATSSGFGKMVNVIILTNTDAYEKNMTDFLGSISLKKPEVAQRQQTTNNQGGSQTALTKYDWKQTSNRKDALGSYAGYSSNTYAFQSNGTYQYSRVDFQSYTPKYYMEDEAGTYQVSGNRITLTPKKSYFHTHQHQKNDPVLRSGNLSLQSVQYTFQNTIINEKETLLLTPVDGKETRRDGVFSFWLNGEKTRSYSYPSVLKANAQNQLPGNEQQNNSKTNNQTITPAFSNGFAFTTTNFDDGWTSTVQEDWVQVTKGTTRVLIHYPNKKADAYNSVLMDGLKNAWNILVAPRYSSASNFEFKPITGWQSIEFAEADMVEKLTGKAVHVVLFKINYSGGNGRFMEFLTPDKISFEREFGPYHQTTSGWETMEKMATYNKFAVAASDLSGKWTNNFTGMQQYVNAYTGASAGADTHASNENFEFTPGNTYKWSIGVASGFVGNIKFQSAKSAGRFSMNGNWKINFSDMEGKPRTFNTYFSCIKGLRILWLDDSAFGKVQ